MFSCVFMCHLCLLYFAAFATDNPFHLVRFVSDIQPWLNEVDADRLRQMMFKKLLVTDSASIKRLQRIQSRDGQSAHNEELIKLLRVGDLTTFRDLCVAIEELGFVDISKAMRSLLPHTGMLLLYFYCNVFNFGGV